MREPVRYVMFFVTTMIVSFLTLGCQACPQEAAIRESMDQGTRKIRADHLAWAEKLAVDPITGKNHANEITPLSQNSLKQIRALHQEYQQLVNDDRQRNPAK